MAQHFLATVNEDGTMHMLFRFGDTPDPRPQDAIDLTEDQYNQWNANPTTLKLIDGQFVSFTPPPAPYLVSKLVLTRRLVAAGLLRTALTALKLDAPLADLTDDELALREEWNSAVALLNTDQQVRDFLQMIGGDPAALLAPE